MRKKNPKLCNDLLNFKMLQAKTIMRYYLLDKLFYISGLIIELKHVNITDYLW